MSLNGAVLVGLDLRDELYTKESEKRNPSFLAPSGCQQDSYGQIDALQTTFLPRIDPRVELSSRQI